MYAAWTARARDEAATGGGISVKQSTLVVMWEEITAVTFCPLQSVSVLHLPPVRSVYWMRCGEFVGLIFQLFLYTTYLYTRIWSPLCVNYLHWRGNLRHILEINKSWNKKSIL